MQLHEGTPKQKFVGLWILLGCRLSEKVCEPRFFYRVPWHWAWLTDRGVSAGGFTVSDSASVLGDKFMVRDLPSGVGWGMLFLGHIPRCIPACGIVHFRRVGTATAR